ncbi:MAG: hypothetical protein JWM59_3970 [Verrucomicrobiales bacterium]|nr:hypothetical protein [Verrucomicrobiales bacterium]
MADLDIFMRNSVWEKVVETISHMLGVAGFEKRDERGVRHVWYLFGMEIIAIDDPDLVDDQGIPFSEFSTEVALILHRTEHWEEAEAFRHAFAVLLVLRLRNLIGSSIYMVRNLQQEIKV